MFKRHLYPIVFAFLVFACGESVKTVTIQPVGNEMRYAQTEFTVTAGSKVRVIMDNIATQAAMVHNVIILMPGTDLDAFGMAALAAGEANGYLPASDAIIASTGLAKPGEMTQVEFTAPVEPGEYPYICTFPGHATTMRGIMKVVAQ